MTDEQQLYDFTKVWKDAAGRMIPFRKLTDTHLTNIICYLQRYDDDYFFVDWDPENNSHEHPGDENKIKLAILLEEQKRRKDERRYRDMARMRRRVSRAVRKALHKAHQKTTLTR